MNFLREMGRSVEEDDNSYKFILIDKNSANTPQSQAPVSSTTTTTATVAGGRNNAPLATMSVGVPTLNAKKSSQPATNPNYYYHHHHHHNHQSNGLNKENAQVNSMTTSSVSKSCGKLSFNN